jgi:hypothetical protein
MIRRLFPEQEPRIAAGLVGQGSECFGFDDEISMDHDYGPSFCLWLDREDYEAIGAELQHAYDLLPKRFLGVPPRQESPNGGGRVGVSRIDAFYGAFVGRYQPPATSMEWFRLPEHNLAAATNGQVFRDDLGRFSAVRGALLSYYPEDVRRKKLAARAVFAAQSGQYNYSRCMRRGETGAAFLCLSEFVENILSMLFLLNRRYAPFYKWTFRALRDLTRLSDLAGPLGELAVRPMEPDAWPQDDRLRYQTTLNTNDPKVVLIEEISARVIEALRAEDLSASPSDFLQDHAGEIMNGIRDGEIRRMHIMEG